MRIKINKILNVSRVYPLVNKIYFDLHLTLGKHDIPVYSADVDYKMRFILHINAH